MGRDEHGVAYPDPDYVTPPPYRCPVCRNDENYYITCNHPACPDGRDQRRFVVLRELEDEVVVARGHSTASMLVGWAVALAMLLWMFWPHPAPAMDHGFDPSDATVKWFESLQRPNMPGSCCGKGDAYPVESYWPNGDGTFTAKIGDGSAIKYPDGTTRNAIPDGAEIPVPAELVNKLDDDQDNPTDVSWIFMTVHGGEVGTVYCLIRHPQGG